MKGNFIVVACNGDFHRPGLSARRATKLHRQLLKRGMAPTIYIYEKQNGALAVATDEAYTAAAQRIAAPMFTVACAFGFSHLWAGIPTNPATAGLFVIIFAIIGSWFIADRPEHRTSPSNTKRQKSVTNR